MKPGRMIPGASTALAGLASAEVGPIELILPFDMESVLLPITPPGVRITPLIDHSGT